MSDRTPKLPQLLNALKKSENWFMFGAMLDVPVSQLKKIELHYQRDPDRCKLELLQYWLDNTLDPTWNEIIQTLEKTDQLVLAAQIKHDYLCSADKMTVLMEKMSAGWLSGSKQLERQQLVADIKRLTSDKADLLTRLQCYEENQKTANELLTMKEKTISGMMAAVHRRDTDVEEREERISHLKKELEELRREGVEREGRESLLTREIKELKNKLMTKTDELDKAIKRNSEVCTLQESRKRDITKSRKHISDLNPLIIPAEPTLYEAKVKYVEQTEYALFELPKKIKHHQANYTRLFCNNIFQEAYDSCKSHLLEEFKMKLNTLVTLPAGRELESSLSADEEECYSDLQRAYGLLLSACKMKKRLSPMAAKEIRVKLEYQKTLPEPHFSSLLDGAVRIAWDMLTLSPPAVLCSPEKFYDEWHTMTGISSARNRYFTLKYYRPLMLSHACGPPAVKAMVIKVASSEPTVNQESDYEDDDDAK